MNDIFLGVLGVAMCLCLLCFTAIYLYKWAYDLYHWIKNKLRSFRETNEVPTVNIHNTIPMEQRLPSYEEAVRQASDLTARRRRRRRRNHSHDNVASDDLNANERGETHTQLDSESTGDSNNGESSNDNENSGTRVAENITLNSGENNVIRFSSNENGNDSNAADDSGVRSGNGDDNVDKFDNTSMSSIYDTASCSSVGGGDSRAPSPWIDF